MSLMLIMFIINFGNALWVSANVTRWSLCQFWSHLIATICRPLGTYGMNGDDHRLFSTTSV